MSPTNRPDAFLFGESPSRIIVSVSKRNVGKLRDAAASADLPLTVLGEVKGNRLTIAPLIDLEVEQLRTQWESTLPQLMGEAPTNE